MKQTRHYKRILAAILAAVLMVAMSLTAFATESAPASGSSDADANQGEITISNPQKDVTYYAYKIFDVTYSTTEGVKSYSYSIAGNSDFLEAVKAFTGNGDATPVTGNGLTLTKAAGADKYVVTTTEGAFSAAAFANAMKTTATTLGTSKGTQIGDGPGAGPNESGNYTPLTTGKNLPLGYYLVVGYKSTGEPLETESLCNLTTTDPSADIKDKNDTPFKKEITGIDEITLPDPVTGKDVQVGSKLTYTITGDMPDISGAATYIYRASDTMSTGLTFNKDVAVKIGTSTVTPEVVTSAGDLTDNQIRYNDPVAPPAADANGGGFELSLNLLEKNGDSYKYQSTDKIVITYTATVNADAVNVISENEAELKYGTDPNNLAESTPQIVRTFSSKIVIDKYKQQADDDTSKKLSGAKFVLKRAKDGVNQYYKGTFTDVPGTDAEGNETVVKRLDKVEWVSETTDEEGKPQLPAGITEVETDENGAAAFEGLQNGTYYLVETEAPAGYNLLTEDVEVTVAAYLTDTTPPELKEATVTVPIANSDGSWLPSTGGIGTTIFYVLGTILITAAVVWFVIRKRVNTNQE